MEAINPTMEQRMEQEGDANGAAFMRDMADTVEATKVSAAIPAASGVSVRRTWKARVTDPKQVPAYFDGYELREINMTALNGLARQYEGRLYIPGVEFYQDSSLSVRA